MDRRQVVLLMILGALLFGDTLKPLTISAQPTSRDDNGISQVWVGAECFPMGAGPTETDFAFADARPQHEVCVTHSFWVDQDDVTNAAYQRFIDAQGYTNPAYWSEEGWRWRTNNRISGPLNFKQFDAPTQPHVGISWYEAEAYARWRGGSLPTEAQWEYVARGPQGKIYPWGDQYVSGKANLDERPDTSRYLGHSSPVGSFVDDQSWVGAYDMVGNVWQWTADWYQNRYYALQVRVDPVGPPSGRLRVLRGGSWGYDTDCPASFCRFHATPNMRSAAVGFRIVTAPSEQ